MKTLFNDNWQFSEYELSEKEMFKNNKQVLLEPEDFLSIQDTLKYKKINVPHDWQIKHVNDLYKNSIGFYKKEIILKEKDILQRHIALNFEGVYMNCAVFVNNTLAGKWKYGYTSFEFDISNLVKTGKNIISVIAVYQSPNTRWYSGAGIYRNVYLINSPQTYLITDGTYIHTEPESKENLNDNWNITIDCEISNKNEKTKIVHTLTNHKEQIVYTTSDSNFTIKNPQLWDINNPYLYTLTTELFDKDNLLLDKVQNHIGFRTTEFTSSDGFYLNNRKLKIKGVCLHHDLGALGAAFNISALKRQFLKLKEMGVNAIRTSHNPVPFEFLDLADKMGFLVNSEIFDMWENPKTQFDYSNYFKQWHKKDTTAWVRKDRNHPCVIMWSIGNEISDTHNGNGVSITQDLYDIVKQNDYLAKRPVTSASNYMWSPNAQKCAQILDLVGYNYAEYFYNDHHSQNPQWKIFGSETASTVQSRGIYHFPLDLQLLTYSDEQCSCLGNCSTTWGAKNTQTVITNERDNSFSQGQFIWTGWDYIGEPTPYHTKNSYFGQIDTAGFEKDTFYLYKSEWNTLNSDPFVHLLPYWDYNEGQEIDIKAYTNQTCVELFLNDKTLGKKYINHEKDMNPYATWTLPYKKGELKAVVYNQNDEITATEIKYSFSDSKKLILEPEIYDTDNLFFVKISTVDNKNHPVENASNFVTIKISGDAELIGLDNGDSTDYDEYQGTVKTHTRKLFNNKMIAIIKAKNKESNFTIQAVSTNLDSFALNHNGNKWKKTTIDESVKPKKNYIPIRKIELKALGSTILNKENPEVQIQAEIFPKNADNKIDWNCILKECVPSENFKITKIQKKNNIQIATIKAEYNGECYIRCSAKNKAQIDKVFSDIKINIEGFIEPVFNPYKFVHACRFTDYDKSKQKPVISLEGGICNREIGETSISFEPVDFGTKKAFKIHIPIFSFDTELPFEIYADDNLIGKFTYKHESVYNTYNENVFELPKELSGTRKLTFRFPTGLEFKGFYFE